MRSRPTSVTARFHTPVLILMLSGCAAVAAQAAGRKPSPSPFAPVLKPFLEQFGRQWTLAQSPDGRLVTLTGHPDAHGSTDEIVSSLVGALHAVHGEPLPVLASPTKSTIGTSRVFLFQQQLDGQNVEGAFVGVVVNDSRAIYDIALSQVPSVDPGPVSRLPTAARTIARTAFCRDLRSPDGALAVAEDDACNAFRIVFDKEEPAPVLLAVDGRIRRVYPMVLRAEYPESSEKTPLEIVRYDVDVTSSSDDEHALLRRSDLLSHFRARGRVFDPDPVRCAGCPPVTKGHVEPSYPPYKNVWLRGLKWDNTRRATLSNSLVEIVDRDEVGRTPVPVIKRRFWRRPSFAGWRGSGDFAAVMAFFHIDRMQRYVAHLGFPDRVARIHVDVDAGQQTQPQSAYLASSDYMYFYQMGPLYVAEDGGTIAHEFGHAILTRGMNDRFGQAEARFVNEGFADYWSLSTVLAAGSGLGRACFAPFLHNGNCVGTTEDETWSPVLMEIFAALGDRNLSDRLILKGHLLRGSIVPIPTKEEMAEGIVIADEMDFNGRHRGAICNVFMRHQMKVDCCEERACSAQPPPLE